MLDKRQKEVVEAKEDKILVISGSGSGKTRVLTERVRFLLKEGVEPSKILAITFTNLAAEEMKERLGDIASDVHISTVHSYANYLLSKNGYSQKEMIEAEDFDAFFDKVEEYSGVLEPVEHLLVDEFQDTSQAQFDFFQMIAPDNFFYVGDDWQAIYGSFSSAKTKFLFNLLDNPEVTVYKLENNYRTPQNILDFAMGFLQKIKGKIVYKDISCKNFDYGLLVERETQDIQFLANYIEKDGNFSEWFVLCRSNALVDKVMWQFAISGIPVDTFKRRDLSFDGLREKLKEDTVKVLTIHSAKGLEADNIAVLGARPSSDEERKVCYVAATRARKKLLWFYNYKKQTKKGNKNITDWT